MLDFILCSQGFRRREFCQPLVKEGRKQGLGLVIRGTLVVMLLGLVGEKPVQAFEMPGAGVFKTLPVRGSFDRVLSELRMQAQLLGSVAGKVPEYRFRNQVRTPELNTSRFQQLYQGIEVLGGQSLRHETSTLMPSSWTHQVASFDLNVEPTLSVQESLAVARVATGGREIQEAPRLMIAPNWSEASATLIYRWVLAAQGDQPGRIVDIDAHSGEVVSDLSRHWTIAPVSIYATNSKCQVLEPADDEGGSRAPMSVNYEECDQVISGGVVSPRADADSVRAHDNAQAVLKYYWTKHSRDSFDDRGSMIRAVVHIGEKWVNAFWDSESSIMAYGDGDGVTFKSLTESVDVAGHEMTHGVVSKTADLEYRSESGAMNEGFADYFGESIEGRDDWVMGATLFKNPADGENGIRNLKDPHQTLYPSRGSDGKVVMTSAPKKYSEIFKFPGNRCGSWNDNCGVHMNATLLGHLGFRLVKAIGRQKADRLLYAVMVHYLTATSDFKALGKAIRQACQALEAQATCDLVKGELAQVEL
ncbi:MAG: hypothetical protein RJB38_1315 [Pseudomonadota bacterium]|jgi:Zn-dependent metalloprotease